MDELGLVEDIATDFPQAVETNTLAKSQAHHQVLFRLFQVRQGHSASFTASRRFDFP
jgi:DNA helicase HerA-like ATPase